MRGRLHTAVHAAVLACLLLPLAGPAASYTVRKKDTLSTIARNHGVTVKAIVKANKLANPDQVTVGQVLKIPASPTADTHYTVRKGDALSTIARTHGVSTKTLIAYNNLKYPDRLNVGDTLVIPHKHSSHAGVHRSLPSTLEWQLNQIPVKNRRWKNIVIHHSATDRGSLQGMDRYHREERHMENGLAYHFVIGNGQGMPDGKIEVGNRWKKQIQGGHLASSRQNQECVGICLVGNFNKQGPSAKQMDSLHALSTYLTRRCRLDKSRIKTHTQINVRPTQCPGKHFPTAAFIADFTS